MKCFPAYKSLQFKRRKVPLFLAHLNCTETELSEAKSHVAHSYTYKLSKITGLGKITELTKASHQEPMRKQKNTQSIGKGLHW